MAVKVGKGSRWYHPFHDETEEDRKAAKYLHRHWLHQQLKRGAIKLKDLAALDGQELICGCGDPENCHAETLKNAAGYAAGRIRRRLK